MRDARRIRERAEIRLDRVQVIWLTLGSVVAMGLMFALGVVVGRRAATFAEVPVAEDPIAAIDEAGEMHEELTFYDELTTKKPLALAPVEHSSSATARRAPEKTAPEPRAEPELVPDKEPATVSPPAPARAQTESALAEGPAKPGEYTIQVSAYQSLEEARAYASSLERKGFKPFIVTATIPGKGIWHRVRLGRFEDESSANRGKRLLASADIPAWVLRTE